MPGSKDKKKGDEPYRSKMTDRERVELVDRLAAGRSSPEDATALLEDYIRALRKGAAAKVQSETAPDNPKSDFDFAGPFDDAARSYASATASSETMFFTVEEVFKDGERKRRSRRRGVDEAAKARQRAALPTKASIVAKWRTMAAAGVPKHERAGKIARSVGCTPKHVRDVLRKANLT